MVRLMQMFLLQLFKFVVILKYNYSYLDNVTKLLLLCPMINHVLMYLTVVQEVSWLHLSNVTWSMSIIVPLPVSELPVIQLKMLNWSLSLCDNQIHQPQNRTLLHPSRVSYNKFFRPEPGRTTIAIISHPYRDSNIQLLNNNNYNYNNIQPIFF